MSADRSAKKTKQKSAPGTELGDAADSGFDVDLDTTGAPAASEDSGPATAADSDPGAEGEDGDKVQTVSFDPASVPAVRRGPLTGKLLEQRYLIKEKLGEGGMGVVYRAEHTLMRKEMAVKVLLPQFGNYEGITRRFHREAQSASRLDHPGIIHINDFGETADGMLFIAMDLLTGRSLTEVIKKESPLPVERAVRLALQLCLALDHAHAQGIVHRDLKPDNVMVTDKGETEDIAKILDFGIAKITQGDGSADALTEAGMVFGTPEYLSPEQAAGQPADARSDVYTVGIILYEMLAGVRPFSAPTKLELIGKHLNEKPVPLRKRRPELDIPAELDRVVLHTLEKRPEDRYQTAAELFQAISGIDNIVTNPLPLFPGNTLTFTAHTGVGTLPGASRGRRRNILLGAIFGGLVAAVATVLIIVFAGGGAGPKTHKPMVVDKAGKRAPDDQIRAVQTVLASANVNAAQTQLDQLADQYPTDPRVHLLAGQIHFLKKQHKECLRSFREAVRLDPNMKHNELLLGHILQYLKWIKGRTYGWKLRRDAMEFVERYLDAGAAKMLSKFANTWWERDLVWRAIEFLIRHNAASKVDFVHAYELVFRNERSCEKRKQYLQDVVKRRDPRFLPLLRKILKTRTWKQKYSRHWVQNGCIEAEVKAAITVLEGLEPADMRPAPPETPPHRH